MRILIIRLSSLGDIFHALSAIARIKFSLPEAKISILVDERFASLMQNCELFDEVLKVCKKHCYADARALSKIHKFDLAIDFQGRLKSAICAKFFTNKIYGYAKSGCKNFLASYLYSHKCNCDYHQNVYKRAEMLAQYFLQNEKIKDYGFCGLNANFKNVKIPNFSENEEFILVHNGSSKLKKAIEINQLAKIINLLSVKFSGKILCAYGSEIEKARAEQIVNFCKNENIQILSKMNLLELINLSKKAKLVIGNDSGPTYIASSIGTKVFMFFKITRKRKNPDRFLIPSKNAFMLNLDNFKNDENEQICELIYEFMQNEKFSKFNKSEVFEENLKEEIYQNINYSFREIFLLKLYLIFDFFIKKSSVKFLKIFANFIARILHICLPKVKNVVVKNLWYFSALMSKSEAEKFSIKIFRKFVFYVFMMVKNQSISAENLLAQIEKFSGEDEFKKLLDSKKPIVFFTAHFGNWEILPSAVALHFNCKLAIVARALKDKSIDELLCENRKSFGVQVIEKTGATKELLRAAKKGKILGFVSDHDAHKNESCVINLWGKKFCQTKAASVLAKKLNAQLVPAFIVQKSDFSYEIILSAGLDSEKFSIEELCEFQCNETKKIIEKYPEEYFWFHKKFKTFYEAEY